jgi:hypothetical protein
MMRAVVSLWRLRAVARLVRARRGGTANRASRAGRGMVLTAKLPDLLLEPSQALSDVSSIGVHTVGSRAREYRVCDCCLVDGVA